MIVLYRTIIRFILLLPWVALVAYDLAMATSNDGLARNGSADSGLELLQKMSLVADTLDYTGEFVYVKEGKISSMKISHIRASATGASQQKLMALDGSMREIIQQNDVVACVLPDQGMGLREKRQAGLFFKLNVSDKLENIAQRYTVTMRRPGRVANRDCERINVVPKDEYRYGYELCIDKETQMLLSSELTDINGAILESYKFVSIAFGDISASDIISETAPKSLTWLDDSTVNPAYNDSAADGSIKWRVAANQSGFELEHYINRISPVMQVDVTHLVLGDGLALVSVFVLPSAASANKSGASFSMGGLNSYSRTVNDYMITVVGEVPRETVMLIAENTELY
jgi:sigma-E factor negative regulatory protein RseB